MAAADRRRRPAPGVRRPGPTARRSLGHPDVALVVSLLPPHRDRLRARPAHPQPPPTTPARALTDQLDLVADSADEQVSGRWVLRGLRRPAVGRHARRGGLGLVRAAGRQRSLDVLEGHAADGWGALRDVLDADIAARSEVLGRHGVGDVLGWLHRGLEWDGHRITVHKPYAEERTIAGSDLVLAPTALGWPGLTVQVCSPEDAVFCYPADASANAEPPGVVARRADRPEPGDDPRRPRRTRSTRGAERPARPHPGHGLPPSRRAAPSGTAGTPSARPPGALPTQLPGRRPARLI